MKRGASVLQEGRGVSRTSMAVICGLLAALAVLAGRAGPSWAQPHQSPLRDTINTPIPTATDGPTSTPSPTTPPGVQRVLLREAGGYDGTSDTWIYAYIPRLPQPLEGGLKLKGGDIRSALIRFDLAGAVPAGAEVVEAELVFYVDIPAFVLPRVLDVAAYRVLREWDEAQASWDYAHTANTVRWQTSGCNGIDVDRLGVPDDTITLSHRAVYRGWNVTESVAHWLDNPDQNFGWVLRGVSASTADFSLGSSRNSTVDRRPVLRIDYVSSGTTATPTPTPTATLEGNSILVTVYNDSDRDGWLDPGEHGLEGVTVELLDDATGQTLDEQVTSPDGTTLFGGLAANWYRLREHNLPGYLSSTADEIRVYVGSVPMNVAFGDYDPSAPTLEPTSTPTRTPDPSGGRIAVTVYDDANRNLWFDPTESGLGGVTVELLDDVTLRLLEERVTASDGTCTWEALTRTWYRLRERNPWGYLSTTPDEVRAYLSSEEVWVSFGDHAGSALALPLIIKEGPGA